MCSGCHRRLVMSTRRCHVESTSVSGIAPDDVSWFRPPLRMVTKALHVYRFVEGRHASGAAEVAKRSACSSIPRACGYSTQNTVPGHLSQNSKFNIYNI